MQQSIEQQCQYQRNHLSLAEADLWHVLSDCHVGVNFLCKTAIGEFIVDFYSPKIKLVIQCDGQFFGIDTSDLDNYLNSCGIRIVHISSVDIRRNFEMLVNILMWEIHIQQVELGVEI